MILPTHVPLFIRVHFEKGEGREASLVITAFIS